MNDDKGSPKPVLIVEQDSNVCNMLSAILEYEGYESRNAATPEEAVAMMREGFKPHLILLMSGEDQSYRELSKGEIPVVSVSSISPLDLKKFFALIEQPKTVI